MLTCMAWQAMVMRLLSWAWLSTSCSRSASCIHKVMASSAAFSVKGLRWCSH